MGIFDFEFNPFADTDGDGKGDFDLGTLLKDAVLIGGAALVLGPALLGGVGTLLGSLGMGGAGTAVAGAGAGLAGIAGGVPLLGGLSNMISGGTEAAIGNIGGPQAGTNMQKVGAFGLGKD